MTQDAHYKDQLPANGDSEGRTILSGEAYQAMLRDLARSKVEIWASLERQVQALEDILAQYNPLDVIGNILFANAVFDAETYKEYAHEGSDAYIEYVALLLLTKSFDTYAERSLEPVPTAIFDTLMQFLFVKDIDPERSGPPSNLIQLQARIVTESIFVRYPSYHHHLLDILTDLFTPLQTELETILGCTIQDALALIEGMEAIMAHRIGERRAKARQSEKEIKAKVKRYRIKQNKRRGRKLDKVPEEEVMYQQWGRLRPSEAAEKIQNMMIAWLFYAIGGRTKILTKMVTIQEGHAKAGTTG